MALTRASIIQRARTRLATEDTQVFTPARLFSAFNDAQRRWAEDVKCLSSEVAADLDANTAEYDLTTVAPLAFEFRKVRVLPSTGGRYQEIGFVSLEDFPEDRELVKAVPDRYSTRGMTTLVLYPIPPGDVTAGLALDCYNYPADLAEDSTADATALSFPVSHREGLTLAMMIAMVEIAWEDDSLQSRLPLLQVQYEAQKVKQIHRNAYPADQPLSYGGTRPEAMSWTDRKMRGARLP